MVFLRLMCYFSSLFIHALSSEKQQFKVNLYNENGNIVRNYRIFVMYKPMPLYCIKTKIILRSKVYIFQLLGIDDVSVKCE